MHSTCSAWGGVGKWARVAVAGVDNDTVAWDPCVDQTLAVADIDRMVMSCLKGIKHFFSLLKNAFFVFCCLECLATLTRFGRYLTSRRPHICQRRQRRVGLGRLLRGWPRHYALLGNAVGRAVLQCLTNRLLTAHRVDVDTGDCDIGIDLDEVG